MIFKPCFLLIFILAFTVFCAVPADLGIECTIFNVGQGSGAVIVDKQKGKSFIVDCGEGARDIGRVKRFNNYVFGTARRSMHVAGVLLSHSDSDHVKLLSHLIEMNRRKYKDQNLDPARRMVAYLGSPFSGYYDVAGSDGEKVLKSLLDVNAKIIPLSHIIPTDRVREKNVAGFDVRPYFLNAAIPEFSDSARGLSLIIMAANAMHGGKPTFLEAGGMPGDLADAIKKPDTVLGKGTNQNSAIVKLTYKEKSVLFPGDVDGDGTDRLVDTTFETYPPAPGSTQAKDFLKADVLVAAHHGAGRDGTNNIAFLLHTNPDYVVISAGEHAGHVHPRFEVLFNLASILKARPLVVPHHFVQSGTRRSIFLKHREGINDIFLLEAGSVITETKPGDNGDNCVWIKMKTQLPIYTTPTNGDIRIIITSTGVVSAHPW